MKSFAVFILVSLLLHSQSGFACNAFFSGDEGSAIVGKSFDFPDGSGVVTINPRGLQKQGFSPEFRSTPHSWVSKYGSVTFNQLGPEYPYGGMNEKGLTIEILHSYTSSSQYYPPKDASPTINESQWIQFQLDTAANVEEVISNASEVRIAEGLMAVHYFVCDPTGNCAVVDFEKGQQVIYSGKDLHAKISTNDPTRLVQENVRLLNRAEKSHPPVRVTGRPEYILAPALEGGSDAKSENPIQYAFEVLEKVYSSDTQWQIVHDMGELKTYFRTPRGKIKTIDLSKLDFSYALPHQVIGLDSTQEVEGAIHGYFRPISESDYRGLAVNLGPGWRKIVDRLRSVTSQTDDDQVIALQDILDRVRDSNRARTLHRYVWTGQFELLSEFVKALPSVDLPNEYGLTPIQRAVSLQGRKTVEIIRLLLNSGADLHQLDAKGRTLLQLARGRSGRPDVIQFLESAVASSALALQVSESAQ